MGSLFSRAKPFVQGRRHPEEQFMRIYFEFGPAVQLELLLKDIYYLELFCSAEQNHLCNSGRMHHQDKLDEIIMN